MSARNLLNLAFRVYGFAIVLARVSPHGVVDRLYLPLVLRAAP